MLSHFIVGDPIQCAFTLQVVAETAFTNLAFVALPDVAARNGDFTLPTTFLSVQSDEARHISNGYATLLTVLQDDSNAPLIERDLLQAWWINHAYLDSFGSGIMEYTSKDRSDHESYLDKWDRWVRDDWYRSYILKLGKLGLNLPTDMFEHARERIQNGMVHKILMGGAAFWPFNFWRSDPLDERDFEWFEEKYPGWAQDYGPFWQGMGQVCKDPEAYGAFLKQISQEPPAPSCWTCLVTCVFPDDLCHREVDGHTRFYCSHECKWLDESNPGRYVGDRNFFDRYHGWELSEIVRDLGFVRPDGKTLVAQPHLDDDFMWTLDDLRKADFELQSPNIVLAEQMGLADGSSHWNGHGNGWQANGHSNGHTAHTAAETGAAT
jgi:propane monooxygenase large subunit